MKVERVSYPMMTPSAARGVLESIFWKPEFVWRVKRIVLLKPIKHFALLRNETTEKLAPSTVAKWMADQRHDSFLIDDARAQRNTLGLRDVAYQIDAQVRPTGSTDPAAEIKYREQFQRRVNRGQCYARPALGCREFAAFFGPPLGSELPHALTADLGQMLFDIRYDRKTGRGTPIFFHARVESGVLEVPPHLHEEVGR